MAEHQHQQQQQQQQQQQPAQQLSPDDHSTMSTSRCSPPPLALSPPPPPPAATGTVPKAAAAPAKARTPLHITDLSEDHLHQIIAYLNPLDLLSLHDAIGDQLDACVHHYYTARYQRRVVAPAVKRSVCRMPSIRARLECEHAADRPAGPYRQCHLEEPAPTLRAPPSTISIQHTVLSDWHVPTIHSITLPQTGDPDEPLSVPRLELIRSMQICGRQTVDARRELRPYRNLHCLRLTELPTIYNLYEGFPDTVRRLRLNRIEQMPVDELEAWVGRRNRIADGGLEWFECREVGGLDPGSEAPHAWFGVFEALRPTATTMWLDARLLRFMTTTAATMAGGDDGWRRRSACIELFVEFEPGMDVLDMLEQLCAAGLDSLRQLHLRGRSACKAERSNGGAKQRFGGLLAQLEVLTMQNIVLLGREFADAVRTTPGLRYEASSAFVRMPNNVYERFVPLCGGAVRRRRNGVAEAAE